MARPRINERQRAMIEQVGRNLARLRKERKLSQERLAEMVGADREYVSECETGKTNFSIVRALEFCEALGANLADLSEGIDLSAPLPSDDAPPRTA